MEAVTALRCMIYGGPDLVLTRCSAEAVSVMRTEVDYFDGTSVTLTPVCPGHLLTCPQAWAANGWATRWEIEDLSTFDVDRWRDEHGHARHGNIWIPAADRAAAPGTADPITPGRP